MWGELTLGGPNGSQTTIAKRRLGAALIITALSIAVAAGGCTSLPEPSEDGDGRVPPGGADAAVFDPMDGNWKLTFSDEFDGPEGQPPDPSAWVPEVGGHGWGNDQLEYDTARVENVSLDGSGHLRITARREAYGERSYTSARIKTQGRFAQTYGHFEARMRLPAGAGLWPAFWLLGNDIEKAGWPACGELDVMEFRGQLPSTVSAAVHGPGYSAGSALSAKLEKAAAEPSFADAFHVFALDWERESVRMSVDDEVYFVVNASQLGAEQPWVFDHDFFIILNLAVGGRFLGPPDEDTVFPQSALVDYVRVYQRTH